MINNMSIKEKLVYLPAMERTEHIVSGLLVINGLKGCSENSVLGCPTEKRLVGCIH